MPGRGATRVLVELAREEALASEALAALLTPVIGRIPTLLECLEVADAESAARLCATLAKMQRPDARAALAVALAMPSVHARRAAAAALAVLASRDTMGHLERALASDLDPEVRRLAAHGLAHR
jgi:HEAT repeat protein